MNPIVLFHSYATVSSVVNFHNFVRCLLSNTVHCTSKCTMYASLLFTWKRATSPPHTMPRCKHKVCGIQSNGKEGNVIQHECASRLRHRHPPLELDKDASRAYTTWERKQRCCKARLSTNDGRGRACPGASPQNEGKTTRSARRCLWTNPSS
jgi:hypothetical protein